MQTMLNTIRGGKRLSHPLPVPHMSTTFIAIELATVLVWLVSLLVDPGAHDNLAGEATMRWFEHQLEAKAVMKRLDQPLNVSGVGKSSQQADRALSVEFQLSNTENVATRCSYTAPLIPNSELPPLLGLRSLQSKRAV